MTARFAHYGGHTVHITFAIADSRPLAVLGDEAGDRITSLLADIGITLHTGTQPLISAPGHLTLHPGQADLEVDRIVTVPTISGPNIPGIPGFALDRFLHIDEHCRVLDTGGRIFAAGDATNLPVKQGGISAQQADTAAAGIVHLAGLGPAAQPLRPHIDATLLTGAAPLYLSAYVINGQGWRATFHDQPPWPPGEKIIAEELGPYLRDVDTQGLEGPSTDRDLRPQPLL
jgi:sulfide:quinone oxidoreductase